MYVGVGGGHMPSWNDMFFALMAFKAKLGTFNVPAQTKLGKWVTKQRQEYSKLQRKKISYSQCSELSEERVLVLDSLGFIWDTMLHENGRRWNQVRTWSNTLCIFCNNCVCCFVTITRQCRSHTATPRTFDAMPLCRFTAIRGA